LSLRWYALLRVVALFLTELAFERFYLRFQLSNFSYMSLFKACHFVFVNQFRQFNGISSFTLGLASCGTCYCGESIYLSLNLRALKFRSSLRLDNFLLQFYEFV
jgi:hypothetical protein